MPSDVLRQFDEVLRILLEVRDIIDGRVHDPVVPAWCASRGWTDLLLSLSREQVTDCETTGPAAWFAACRDAPESLRSVARRVQQAVAMPDLGSRALHRQLIMTSVRERKRIQIRALVESLRPLAMRSVRVVDVGCGAGHLTRIVAEQWGRDAVGLERNHDLVAQAAELARLAQVEFHVCDVFEDDIDLHAGDLVVGLHACGEVADVALAAAVRARASAAFVSCCQQKVRGASRPAISRHGRDAGLVLSREVLGLSNLSSRAMGVEVPLQDTMAARRVRLALRVLLRARGVALNPGDEMRGINRRRARKGFEAIAADAMRLRGLPSPTAAEIRDSEATAREQFDVIRRLSLPRNMLARLVECAIVLDRAALLDEHGYDVVVATVFDQEVSPRNLAVVGQPRT